MKELLKKITILCLCLPASTIMVLLSSSMVKILENFSQYSEALVTMVVTLPTLTIVPGLLLAPILLKRFQINHLIAVGLTVFLVFNMMCIGCDSLTGLLLLRGISGVGCGLIIPLYNTLIAAYPEKERAVLIGLNLAIGCLLSAIMTSVSGFVAEVNWKYVFYLFLVNAPLIVMSLFFLPKEVQEEGAESGEVQQASEKKHSMRDYAGTIFQYYLLITASYLFVTAIIPEMAPFLEQISLGDSGSAGILVSVYMVGAFLSGIGLQPYLDILQKLSMPVVFITGAIGFFMLAVGNSLIVIGIAAFILGFSVTMGFGVITFYLTQLLPLDLYTGAVAGLNVFVYLLEFFAPMLFLAIVGLIPSGSFRTGFFIYFVEHAVFIVISYIIIAKGKKQNY